LESPKLELNEINSDTKIIWLFSFAIKPNGDCAIYPKIKCGSRDCEDKYKKFNEEIKDVIFKDGKKFNLHSCTITEIVQFYANDINKIK